MKFDAKTTFSARTFFIGAFLHLGDMADMQGITYKLLKCVLFKTYEVLSLLSLDLRVKPRFEQADDIFF